MDPSAQDLAADPTVSLTFSEGALGGPACVTTAESPLCARFTIAGRMTLVPEESKAEALRFLFAKHPEMESWPEDHGFAPYWIAPENISSFFFVDMFGGSKTWTVDEW